MTRFLLFHQTQDTTARELPDTLAEMAELPVAYRRAAFNELSPATRFALWRENLTQIAAGPLTDEQRALVLSLRESLRTDFYVDTASSSELKQATVGSICERVATLFSTEQRRMLATLGPVEYRKESRLVTVVRQVKSFLPSYLVNANSSGALHTCECVEDTHCLDCNTGMHCGFSTGCSETWFGCGCAAVFGCTKVCQEGEGEN